MQIIFIVWNPRNDVKLMECHPSQKTMQAIFCLTLEPATFFLKMMRWCMYTKAHFFNAGVAGNPVVNETLDRFL